MTDVGHDDQPARRDVRRLLYPTVVQDSVDVCVCVYVRLRLFLLLFE